MRLLWSVSAQTFVAMKLPANRRFVDIDLVRQRVLSQTGLLQGINLVALTLSEAVIGSHSCSFTFDGEKHLGIAASRIIPWVKLHWRVESALYYTYSRSTISLTRPSNSYWLWLTITAATDGSCKISCKCSLTTAWLS